MRREKDTGILGRRKNDKRRFKLITETSTICLDITINKFFSWWHLEMTDKKLDSVNRHWEFNQREENQKNRHTQPISQFHRALQRYLDTSTEQIKDQQHFSVHQDCAAEIKIDASQLTEATKSCTIVGSHSGPLRLTVISEF